MESTEKKTMIAAIGDIHVREGDKGKWGGIVQGNIRQGRHTGYCG